MPLPDIHAITTANNLLAAAIGKRMEWEWVEGAVIEATVRALKMHGGGPKVVAGM